MAGVGAGRSEEVRRAALRLSQGARGSAKSEPTL